MLPSLSLTSHWQVFKILCLNFPTNKVKIIIPVSLLVLEGDMKEIMHYHCL